MSDRSIFLRLDAPFSAFRWMQAGVFRGTFPVIPHSAAWGLALNLGGIETRGSLDEAVTNIRRDAPHLGIAVGVIRHGERSTLYQQLHSYPVGNASKHLQPGTHGSKYHIAPAKRELLVGLCCVVGVRGPVETLNRIPKGLRGTLDGDRYGLPFAGDNQFLFDRIDLIDMPTDVRWYVPVKSGEKPTESTRLTTNIDRGDSSRTSALLFAPTTPSICPELAWVKIGPAPTNC